jgi:transketolase
VHGDLDQLSVATIRTLAMDAVQKARSGHPGTPMALAPVAYVLWQRFLRYDPADPIWPNRDRFVLSNGHASMLLYALLHLSGVKAVDPDYELLDRARARRVRSRRRDGRPPRAAAPRDGQRGAPRARRPRSAHRSRRRCPRREHAVLGALRAATSRVPGERAATRCEGASRRGAASTLGWDRYVGSEGAVVGMHTFGASAPLKALQTRFGFTPEAIVSTASALLARREG